MEQKKVKTFRANGDFVGAYADYLLERPSSLTMLALTDCEVYSISTSDLTLLGADTYWESKMKMVSNLQYIEKDQRENELLSNSASENYEVFKKRYKSILIHIPDYEIAHYLNVTPGYFSRLKNGFV